MKQLLTITILLFGINARADFPEIKGLVFDLLQKDVKPEGIQSQSMLNWHKWISQPGVNLLLPTSNYKPKEDLTIYHSRTYFVVNKNSASLKKEHFQNMKFFESVNPSSKKDVTFTFAGITKTIKDQELGSKHSQINQGVNGNCSGICVKTQIQFHPFWQAAIWAARMSGALKENNAGHLEVDSENVFLTSNELNAQTKQGLASLVKTDLAPAFMFHQAGYKVNQMVQFTGSTVVGYALGDKTLIVLDVALGIEQDIDTKVKTSALASGAIKSIFGKDPNTIVGNVLLGKEPGVNVNDGIGKGLPAYTLEMSNNLKRYLEAIK